MFPDVQFDAGETLQFTWSKKKDATLPRVSLPDPRSGHAAFKIFADDPRFFVQGGANADSSFCDLYCYHTALEKWTRIDLWCPPDARCCHTLCVVGPDDGMPMNRKLPRPYLFGGFLNGSVSRTAAYVVNFWRLMNLGEIASRGMLPPKTKPGQDLSRPPRSKVAGKDGVPVDTWERHAPVGVVPLSRCNHTMTEVGGRAVYLLFGWNSAYMNHVYRMDVASNTWEHVKCKLPIEFEGQPPFARAGHSATLVDGRYIVVFGGQDRNGPINELIVLDVRHHEWIKPNMPKGNIAPRPRSGHTATFLPEQQCVVMYGGFLGEGAAGGVTDEVLVLMTRGDPEGAGWRWETCTRSDAVSTSTDKSPGPRVGHSAVAVDDTIFIFGGQTLHEDGSNIYMNDVFGLTIEMPDSFMPEVESLYMSVIKKKSKLMLQRGEAGDTPVEESTEVPISPVARAETLRRITQMESDFDAEFAAHAQSSGLEIEDVLESKAEAALASIRERRRLEEEEARRAAEERASSQADDMLLEDYSPEKSGEDESGSSEEDDGEDDGLMSEGSNAEDDGAEMDEDNLVLPNLTMEEKLAQIGPNLQAAIAIENERIALIRRNFNVSESLTASGSDHYDANSTKGKRDGAMSRPRRANSMSRLAGAAAGGGGDGGWTTSRDVPSSTQMGAGRAFRLQKDASFASPSGPADSVGSIEELD